MSERLYRWLLRLYPRAFRERYEDEMIRVLRDRLSHEPASTVWLDVLRDAAVSIPRQHLRPRPTGPRAPQWQDMVPQGTLIAALAMSGVLGALAGVRIFLLFVEDPWSPLSLFVDGALVMLFAAVVWRAVVVRRANAGLRAEATAGAVAVLKDDVRLQALRREDVVGAREQFLGLRLQSAAAGDMFVPRRMRGYESVRQYVAGWVPLTRFSVGIGSPFHLILTYTFAILAPPLHTPSGAPFAVLLLFAVAMALREPALPVARKLLYLGACVVPALGWWLR